MYWLFVWNNSTRECDTQRSKMFLSNWRYVSQNIQCCTGKINETLRIHCVFFMCSRCQKEAVSHLSPVKKRVKENTPPHTTTSTSQQSQHHKSEQQHSEQQQGFQDWSNVQQRSAGETRQTIVIADSPSPVSVITISSDSEDDDNRCSPKGWVVH